MKIAVNLASRPYIDLRPIYNRLRTWIVILALVGGALWYLYRNESDEAQAARAQVTTVESRVRELEQKQQEYRRMMQQPKDAGILQQSEFLNSLFQRKAFSWTATMTDLETVLPTGVQVLSIDPIVAQDGHVIIRLRVTGERDHALELVRNLEKSKHFAAPRLATESLATAQGSAAIQNVSTSQSGEFRYSGRLSAAAAPARRKREAGKGGADEVERSQNAEEAERRDGRAEDSMNRVPKLNLHFLLLALVVAADVFIGVRFALAWRAIRSNQSGAFIQEEARLQQLESQMKHLNGLPQKVNAADADAQKFYGKRIAPNWSTVLAQLGSVAAKNNVKLSRAAYPFNPAPAGGLTELHIDAGLSGTVF